MNTHDFGGRSGDYAVQMIETRLGCAHETSERLCGELAWFLKVAASEQLPVTPSVIVDKAWHALRDDEDAYERFSFDVCGHVVVHQPSPEPGAAYRRTLDSMSRMRGFTPHEFWPAADAGPCEGSTVIEKPPP